jgi:phosphatidylglycerophosphate synthase
VNPKLWPNVLSATRIAFMPAVLTAAMAGSRFWFVVLLATSLATDALDGFLARRLNAFSDLGRKLDSAADYLVVLTAIAGIALLWTDIVRREIVWIAAGLAAFFAVIVYGLVRTGRPPCYHTWAAKSATMGTALSLLPLLAGWSTWPFHAAVILQLLAAFEEMTITLILPSHVGEMASVWHAWRQRRDSMALLRRPRRARARASVK